MNKKGWGAVFAVLSAALYGLSSVLTKKATDMGVPVFTLMLFRGLIGAAVLFAYARIKGGSLRIARSNIGRAVLLASLGTALTLIFLNYAYLYLPVGTVTTIHFFYPVAVNIVTALIYKEKIPGVTVVTMVVCTAAITLFFKSFDSGASAGLVLTLLSIASWTFQMIYLERSGLLRESTEALSLVLCLVTAATGAVLGFFTGTLAFGGVLKALPYIAGTAVFNNVLANLFLQKGVRGVGAGAAAVLSVFEPISSLFFGVIILKESIGALQAVAGGVIIVSVAVMLSVIARGGNRDG